MAEGADPEDVKIGRVLVAKDDAAHLFDEAADQFETGAEFEVAEGVPVIDTEREMFIGRIHSRLGENPLADRGRYFGVGSGGGDEVGLDLPLAGQAGSRQGGVKARGQGAGGGAG